MVTSNNVAAMNFQDIGGNALFENGIGLLTVEQLAGALGFAPKTLRNWVALREIPFVRIGRRTMFRIESIGTWLKRKESKPWQ